MEYNLPVRKFCSGQKKLATWRLPSDLLEKLEQIAESHGWTTTDVVMTALDQFVQWSEEERKKKTPRRYEKK